MMATSAAANSKNFPIGSGQIDMSELPQGVDNAQFMKN